MVFLTVMLMCAVLVACIVFFFSFVVKAAVFGRCEVHPFLDFS